MISFGGRLPAEFELLMLSSDSKTEQFEKLALADAIIVASTPLTQAHVDAAPRLTFVHHQGVGYHDTVDIKALASRGIPLAITPGGTTTGVAEHTVLLILAVLKRLPFADSELRSGRFLVNSLRPVSRELSGRTVGLLGIGRIGRAVAERLAPFGVNLLYHDLQGLSAEEETRLALTAVSFGELLERADIVSLHLPLTSGTHHMIDTAALGRMRSESYIVNTARGGLIDEGALIVALEEKRIAGAALDVFDPEPPSPGNSLYRLPNVVLTPHISAGTRDAFTEKMTTVFDHLGRFARGERIEDLVDLEAEIHGQAA